VGGQRCPHYGILPPWSRPDGLTSKAARAAPTRVRGAGEVASRFRGFRVEHLRHLGWRAYNVERYQNWCGHTQEIIPFPTPDGTVLFIPVMGEAS